MSFNQLLFFCFALVFVAVAAENEVPKSAAENERVKKAVIIPPPGYYGHAYGYPHGHGAVYPYDDGKYHPGKLYDDGKYHPGKYYDDGKYYPGKYEKVAAALYKPYAAYYNGPYGYNPYAYYPQHYHNRLHLPSTYPYVY